MASWLVDHAAHWPLGSLKGRRNLRLYTARLLVFVPIGAGLKHYICVSTGCVCAVVAGGTAILVHAALFISPNSSCETARIFECNCMYISMSYHCSKYEFWVLNQTSTGTVSGQRVLLLWHSLDLRSYGASEPRGSPACDRARARAEHPTWAYRVWYHTWNWVFKPFLWCVHCMVFDGNRSSSCIPRSSPRRHAELARPGVEGSPTVLCVA